VGHAELLRRNASFRLLFLATLGSLVGTWLATIALTVEIYDRTHSGGWISALLISIFLPTVIVGVAVGPLLDRLSRRSLMIAVRPLPARASSWRCPSSTAPCGSLRSPA
jgi:MFS family permease